MNPAVAYGGAGGPGQAWPLIIQGGMGAAVSGWKLARAVSRAGQLGVVSGTAMATVLARRLQLGDLSGRVRHALAHFPVASMVSPILDRYFISGGKRADQPFRLVPMPSLGENPALERLTVVANFVEVFLAREGHRGLVGINLLEKIQLPTLPSLFGAMLAGVDYVLMGAGIPRNIPQALDCLASGKETKLKIDVADAGPEETFFSTFHPAPYLAANGTTLKRPRFLGIVASATLAITLARKSTGRVDGFVVEDKSAGGHVAPPRGRMCLSEKGEPIYGDRDVPELEKIRALGLPFWLAGSFGWPGKLREALDLGAKGIQVGTAFAFCRESGVSTEIKGRVIQKSAEGKADVFTDPLASPTGFPLKVLQMEDTLSESSVYARRKRVCDLGYLRQAYRKADGSVGYRCPGEPEADYVRKGGEVSDTEGRKCVCNGLLSTAAMGQSRCDGPEQPLVTAGNAVAEIRQFAKPGRDGYSAVDVIRSLLGNAGVHE